MNYYDYKIFAMIVQMLEIIMTKKFFPISTSTDAVAFAAFGSRSSGLINDDDDDDDNDPVTGSDCPKNDVSQ